MSFVLIWSSQYGKEEIDTADTRKEAEFLKREYLMAYGEGTIQIKKVRGK